METGNDGSACDSEARWALKRSLRRCALSISEQCVV